MHESGTRWRLMVRITSQPLYPCGYSLSCQFGTGWMDTVAKKELLSWSEIGTEFIDCPGRCLVTVLTELS